MKLVVSDRYSAVGFNRPDPKHVCKGKCEGMGVVPSRVVHGPSKPMPDAMLQKCTECQRLVAPSYLNSAKDYDTSSVEAKYCDGWHFFQCPQCHGTGSHDFVDRRRKPS